MGTVLLLVVSNILFALRAQAAGPATLLARVE
jgi:hypothetical protein